MRELPVEDTRLLSAYQEALALVGETYGIIGVDVGFIHRDAHRTDELGIRVYAAEAEVWSELGSTLPTSIQGVTVSRVTAMSRMRGLSAPQAARAARERGSFFDPLRPGISVSNLNKAGGTLGLIVDHATKGRCILSCDHVLVYDESGTERTVVQPAGGGEKEQIGVTDTHFDDDDGDAAIAVLNAMRGTEPAQFETDVVIRAVRRPRRGEIVTKSGVGTGVTSGMVARGGRFIPPLRLNKLLPRRANLKDDGMDGFVIVPIDAGSRLSAGEDSGSIWYARSDHAGVGLHVYGELLQDDLEEEFAVACYLSVVLRRLEVAPAETRTP